MVQNTSQICARNVSNRPYYSADLVFGCEAPQILNRASKMCENCPVQQAPNYTEDLRCHSEYWLSECQTCVTCPFEMLRGECRVCDPLYRRLSRENESCVACPEFHVQSNDSEFSCEPCPLGFHVLGNGCQACSGEYLGDPLFRDIPRCVLCPVDARQQDDNLCKCPPGYSQNPGMSYLFYLLDLISIHHCCRKYLHTLFLQYYARPLKGFKPNPATGNSNVAQNKLKLPIQIDTNGVHWLG